MTYIADRIPHTRRRRSLITALLRSFEVARQRRALRRLDAEALDDIGISRAEALRESRRPAWDAPDHWHC
jgi:uncharacterized protein YjiS (DUF1127 family)